jgi:hypothetical protein
MGVVKVLQPLPVQPSVEGGTDFSARSPKFDVVGIVGHRVLYTFYQPAIDYRRQYRKKPTFIIVRIAMTVPKTALAGATVETSFPRFMASMVVFSQAMAFLWRFSRRALRSVG